MGTRLPKGPSLLHSLGTQAVCQSRALAPGWGGEYRELLWRGEAGD